MDVADELSAVAPRAGELPRLAQGRVAMVHAGDAGVHEQPQDERLGRIPDLPKLVTVSLALRKDGGDGGIGRPGGAHLAAGIVVRKGWAHGVAAGGPLRRVLPVRRFCIMP